MSRFFDPTTVADLLSRALGPDAAAGRTVGAARAERCWPGRNGQFAFEWSFALGRGPRRTLFGVVPADTTTAESLETRVPEWTPEGPRGVCAYLPDCKLLVHSPDADPGLCQLSECLTPGRMAARLRPYWGGAVGRKSAAEPAVDCRLLGYRAGRRAAIAYRQRRRGRGSAALLGKTFRDGRGERLAELHRQLGPQLAWHSHGRVLAPSAADYLPDVRMVLFDWAVGDSATDRLEARGQIVGAAVEVLATLHRTELDGLPVFTVDEERRIMKRWHRALRHVDPSVADAAAPLLEGLLAAAETVAPAPQRTIHRDFHDRQIIVHDQTTTLLDLDTLARGDPCVDLGNLVAHLYLAALMAEPSARGFAALTRDVARQYERQLEPVNRRTLAFFSGTALFRVGAVHALRTTTRRHSAALWAQAARVLAGLRARRSASSRAPRGGPLKAGRKRSSARRPR